MMPLRVLAAMAIGTSAASISFAQPAAITASATAHSTDTALVSDIAARLSSVKGIRADFTQTQTLSAMKQPLVSAGSLLFDRARGVIWRIISPYKVTYVISDSGVREIDAAGQVIRAGSTARGAAQVSRMMRDMLGGDLSALYAQFDVEASGTPARWTMVMRPNQPQLAQSIRSLQMRGGAYLQALTITFANGNVTAMVFTRSAPAGVLTPVERSWLGAR